MRRLFALIVLLLPQLLQSAPPFLVSSTNQPQLAHIRLSGEYRLTENLTCKKQAFTIDANDVCIDLQGFSLATDLDAPLFTLAPGRSGITIKNGSLRSCKTSCIQGTKNRRVNAENLQVDACQQFLHLEGASFVGAKNISLTRLRSRAIELRSCDHITLEEISCRNTDTQATALLLLRKSHDIVCRNIEAEGLAFEQPNSALLRLEQCRAGLLSGLRAHHNQTRDADFIHLHDSQHLTLSGLTVNHNSVSSGKHRVRALAVTGCCSYLTITKSLIEKNDAGPGSFYGIHLADAQVQNILLEENVVQLNRAAQRLYGIYDETALGQTTLSRNVVAEHGSCLAGDQFKQASHMNYNLANPSLPLSSLLKEAATHELPLAPEDYLTRNISLIKQTLPAHF